MFAKQYAHSSVGFRSVQAGPESFAGMGTFGTEVPTKPKRIRRNLYRNFVLLTQFAGQTFG
jgi:hypothetical protein